MNHLFFFLFLFLHFFTPIFSLSNKYIRNSPAQWNFFKDISWTQRISWQDGSRFFPYTAECHHMFYKLILEEYGLDIPSLLPLLTFFAVNSGYWLVTQSTLCLSHNIRMIRRTDMITSKGKRIISRFLKRNVSCTSFPNFDIFKVTRQHFRHSRSFLNKTNIK